MYLLIDNYDSFTYNLFQAFAKHGVKVLAERNDRLTLRKIERMEPEKMIVSPGPGRPDDAGISKLAIKHFMDRVPILGVCLGFQCIAEVLGGNTSPVPSIVHGMTSAIRHNSEGIFKGVKNPFEGARYHSLMSMPDENAARVTAFTDEGIPMALEHREYPLVGVQFHPESFMTEEGEKIIKNFINL